MNFKWEKICKCVVQKEFFKKDDNYIYYYTYLWDYLNEDSVI